MNRKGQIGLSVILTITFFLIGMATLNFIRDEITDVRLADSLDCSNISISDGNKLTCLTVDIALPYFILLIISASLGVITSKIIL